MNQKIINLIKNYQAPKKAAQLVSQARPVFLAGITGAGKDTIKNELLKNSRFRHLVSHTTRPKRINNGVMETDGVEYHFIDHKQLEIMLEGEQFIEVKQVHDKVYGTSLSEFEQAIDNNQFPITDIDIQGVAEYYKLDNNLRPIFVLPPSYQVWLERFSKRYQDKQKLDQELTKRIKTSIIELEQIIKLDYYHFVINDDLEQAVKQVEEFVFNNGKLLTKNQVLPLINQLLEKIKSNTV